MNREQAPRRIDAPEPCFVRMKLVRGGAWVGARVFPRLGMMAAEINGVPCEPDQVWQAGELIDRETYDILMSHPRPNPYHPVHVSEAGLAERVREAEEADWWMTRPIREAPR